MRPETQKAAPAQPVDTDTPLKEVPHYPIPTRSIWDPINKKPSAGAEAFWAPEPKKFTPYEELIPAVGSDRRSRVARNIASGILQEKNFREPGNQYRPKTFREQAMAWRAGQKKFKADIRNMEASSIADRYKEPDLENPGQFKINFDRNRDNLSPKERRRAEKDKKRYDKLRKQAARLMTGRTIPLIGKSVMGFEQILGANKQPAQPAKRKTA